MSILEVNLRRLGKKNRSRTNIRDKKQHTVLAGAAHYRDRMQVSKMFTLKFIFCPSKANSWRLPSISWQITEVSNSTRRHADNSGNRCRPIKFCHGTIFLMAELYLTVLPITRNEVPFMNTSEATKKVE